MTQATTTPATLIRSTDDLLIQARELAGKIHTAHLGDDTTGVAAMVEVMKLLAARAQLVSNLEVEEYQLIYATQGVVNGLVSDKTHTAQDTMTALTALETERYHLKERSRQSLAAIKRLEAIALATVGS